MDKAIIEFPLDKNGNALFDANNSVGSGVLTVSITRGFPCPVCFSFKRGKKECSFAMDKTATRKLIAYLLVGGI